MVYSLIDFEIEEVNSYKKEDRDTILLPELTEEEKRLIDPIVAPTSGLRIQIFDIRDKNLYFLTQRKLFLFLRVFKAISLKYKKLKNNKNLNVLIVTDDRPSKDILLRYCSEIFASDGFTVYYQEDIEGESKLSSPYAAASVALLNDINLILMLTASHNELSWNGIKFYIDYPMPMSGDMFKEISKCAIELQEITLKRNYIPEIVDAERINNEYVKQLLADVLEIKSIKGKNIVIWPYLGKARGIVNLFKDYGANVILIDEEINPPNPIKELRPEKLQKIMHENNSDLALLLDADRDRIALYAKQNGEYYFYIPNEIYSAMHNILAKSYGKKIFNIRTIPSDLRGDNSSFLNILTGVGYKHLGIILYYLFDVEVEKSKVDSAILYLEDQNKNLIKINNPTLLKEEISKFLNQNKPEFFERNWLIVMWEESGGHTLNVFKISPKKENGKYKFITKFPLIADKYPVPALVLITELISRGHIISESIDWSIKGINQTIPAIDEEKVRIMNNFKKNDDRNITIAGKDYSVKALSDNIGNIDIYQLKSQNSTLYFRPSGTGPDVRFYIFGNRKTHLDEIKDVQKYINENYM
ncbi:MAG: hypothetical protein MUP85_22950, partial [Candidatus Lokiarchaeota archaeon]|nr:hypothetical protein [Candidatus Lokiarchaeota archaeon]